MSINNLTNTFIPNTLSGLETLNVSDITINGIDVTALFVPYAGANANVDLNNKSLTGVNALTATSVVVSGTVQGQNLTATGLTSSNTLTTTGLVTANTLKINSVPAGTVAKALAVDAAGNVIEGSAIPSQFNITQIAGGYASPLYFTFLTSTAAGAQVIYSDDLSPMTYNTNSKTLSIKNLSATSGTWNNTGSTFSQTLTCGSLSIGSVATFPQYCNFSTVPSVGTPAYFLAVDALNQVVVATGISAQPTITATNTNATYYLTFAPNATTTASSPLYVDGGASLTYNAFSNTLTVPIADIPTSLTANGSFTANGSNSIAGYAPLASPALTGIPTAPTAIGGTNTTQLATTAFVTSAIPSLAGYALLASPAFTGTPTAPTATAGTNTSQLATTAFVATSFAPTNSPNFTGTPQAPTATVGTSNFQLANTAFVATSFAPLASPIFTGSPNAPTQSFGNNSTLLATTAFVQSAIPSLAGYLALTGGTMTGTISIDAGNSNFIEMVNSKTVVYNYTISSNGTSGPNTFLTFRAPASMIGVGPLLTITPPTICSSTLDVTGATTITGATTANGALVVNNGGLNYANFGGSSMNLLRGNTVFYSTVATGGNAVLQVDWASGINASVLNTAQYNWQFVTGSSGSTAMNLTTGGLLVGVTVLQMNSANYPHILLNASGTSGGNYIGQATGAGNFINDAATGDLCINSRTGNIRLAGGAQYANSGLVLSNGGANFNVAGVAVAGYNNVGLYANNAGYLTSYQQANAAGIGLTGGSTGDLIMYANSSNTIRIYAGTTQISAFGTYAGLPLQLWKSNPVWYIEGTSVSFFMGTVQSGTWDTGTGGLGNWRMLCNAQLQLGGSSNFVNIQTPPMDNPNTSAWTGGCLFTQTFGSASNKSGINIGFNENANWGHIVCLSPSIAWKELYINAGYIYAFSYGSYSALLQPGGWVNVSDEREKTNIKPLKTTRSLERVLAAKTFTYNRLFYLDSSGNDLTPQELKDKSHVGIMAQQIKESNPHCLTTFNSINSNNEERFAVNYNDYVTHLIGAVQEQQKQIIAQQATIDLLTKHLADLTNQVNEITKKLI